MGEGRFPHGFFPPKIMIICRVKCIQLYLVGGIPTPLKNMKVSGGYYSQYNGKIKGHVPNHQPVIENATPLSGVKHFNPLVSWGNRLRQLGKEPLIQFYIQSSDMTNNKKIGNHQQLVMQL